MDLSKLPDVLDDKTLSEYLGLARTTLQRMRVRGDGPKFYRVGTRVRYAKADVADWIGEPVSSVAEANRTH